MQNVPNLETQNPNAEEPENRLYEYLNQIEQLIFGSGEKDGLLAIDSEATMGIKNSLSERKKKRLDRFIDGLGRRYSRLHGQLREAREFIDFMTTDAKYWTGQPLEEKRKDFEYKCADLSESLNKTLTQTADEFAGHGLYHFQGNFRKTNTTLQALVAAFREEGAIGIFGLKPPAYNN